MLFLKIRFELPFALYTFGYRYSARPDVCRLKRTSGDGQMAQTCVAGRILCASGARCIYWTLQISAFGKGNRSVPGLVSVVLRGFRQAVSLSREPQLGG